VRVGDDGVEIAEEIQINTVTTSLIEITEVQEDEFEVGVFVKEQSSF
jgi:NH3-dependent NAD+ synthetase